MNIRWSLPTVLSLSLSFLSLAGVIVLALVSCTTTVPVESSGSQSETVPATDTIVGLRELESSFHAISESVAPSIVRIDVRERVTQNGPQEGLPFFDFFFGRPDDSEPKDRGFDRDGVGSLGENGLARTADRATSVISPGSMSKPRAVSIMAGMDLVWSFCLSRLHSSSPLR